MFDVAFPVAWQMSEAITFTIVQRENGLQHINKMLEEGESDVKRMAVSLIRNLSRYWELHPEIGNFTLFTIHTCILNLIISVCLPPVGACFKYPFCGLPSSEAGVARDGDDAAQRRHWHRPAHWGDGLSVSHPEQPEPEQPAACQSHRQWGSPTQDHQHQQPG